MHVVNQSNTMKITLCGIVLWFIIDPNSPEKDSGFVGRTGHAVQYFKAIPDTDSITTVNRLDIANIAVIVFLVGIINILFIPC